MFPCEKEGMDKEIIDIVKRIILPGIKLDSIEQIWSTILYELSSGFLVEKKSPKINLSYNNEELLYSEMYDYYKNTLIGHILLFLDYFMKGFLHGGFFDEDFIYNWEKTKNISFSYLQENFNELKRYLYKQNLNDLDYDILSIFSDDDINYKNEKNIFFCKVRIIGLLRSRINIFKNIFFPELYYTINGEMEIDPIIFNNEIEEYASKISELNTKLKQQKLLIYMNFKNIPYFQGYLFLLNLITFAIHTLFTIINKKRTIP